MSFIIPCPKKAEVLSEEKHNIPLLVSADPKWEKEKVVLTEAFAQIFEAQLGLGRGGIELVYDSDLAADAYVLDTQDTICVRASHREGLLYGMASLLQLISIVSGTIRVQSMIVEDHPDKQFRAFMLDLGHCTQPFSKLRKYIDLCFLYKVNHLHIHFADDDFYMLPSREFPALPAKGKHYTFEQIRQLNAYAASRGIHIIPEFESPGHVTQLNKAYREVFGCHFQEDVGEFFRNPVGQIHRTDSIICAGSEQAFEGVKRILKEIAEMFPDAPYIHIGGDEADHELWEKCSVCQAYMKEHNIASTKELYGEFIGRVADYVVSLGRIPMVWEGFPKFTNHYIPKQTVVIAWESHYQLATELLADGFKIINATWQPLYLVSSINQRWTPKEILQWNVYNWQHWWRHSYATLNPINIQPTDQVLGANMCSWGLKYEGLIGRLMENLAAMSERVWTVERKRDYDTYVRAYANLYRIASRLVEDRE